ncbi:MAG TPA: hypothetical protein VG796_29355 [Verrucomicrobiales bacterium]|jgi:hypothetical protein|nr:hypothetical protein [Verrucomicrobiales bacterium]
MTKTLEERVAALEKELAEMKARPWLSPPMSKDWMSTVGWAAESDVHDAAALAGEDYRRNQTYEKELETRGGSGH